METEIKITENGEVTTKVIEGPLLNFIWDAFLTADQQDEQWSDSDTCLLIVKKLKGL